MGLFRKLAALTTFTAGAAVGLLFSTKSGKEIRNKLAQQKTPEDKAKILVREAKEAGMSLWETLRPSIMKAKESIRKDLKKLQMEVKKDLEKLKSAGKKQVQEIKAIAKKEIQKDLTLAKKTVQEKGKQAKRAVKKATLKKK